MSKNIDLQITKVGNIVMLEEEDWNRVVEYLRVHDLNVTEKPVQSDERYVHAELCALNLGGDNCDCGALPLAHR